MKGREDEEEVAVREEEDEELGKVREREGVVEEEAFVRWIGEEGGGREVVDRDADRDEDKEVGEEGVRSEGRWIGGVWSDTISLSLLDFISHPLP